MIILKCIPAAGNLAAIALLMMSGGESTASSVCGTTVTVPPGGFAWTALTNDGWSGSFTAASVPAHGPLIYPDSILPEYVHAAAELCGDWIAEDLKVRFFDLLYETASFDGPVQPFFADVDGDGHDDLIAVGTDGTVLAAFIYPYRTSSGEIPDDLDMRRYVEIDHEGIIDSLHLCSDGLLRMLSGGEEVSVIAGFGDLRVSGTATGHMDGDLLPDLVIGTETGRLLVFRNLGTLDQPLFMPFRSDHRVLFPDIPGTFTSPAAFLRDDSTVTVAVGTQHSGLVLLSARIGDEPGAMIWTEERVACDGANLLNLSPVAVDSAGSRIILCSDRNGGIYRLDAESLSLVRTDLPVVPGSYASLATACISDDSYPDLVAGTMEGGVYILQGSDGWFRGGWTGMEGLPPIPSGAPASWRNGLLFGREDGGFGYFARNDEGNWVDSTLFSEFHELDAGEYSAPVFFDLDGDGTMEMITGSADGALAYHVLEESASSAGALFVERFSWRFEPNSAVPDVASYYARYFSPFSVLRSPEGTEIVDAYVREITEADPRLRDEIAYCIAHTPTNVLRTMYENGDSDLFAVNAAVLYEIAEALDYVVLDDRDGRTVCSVRTGNGSFEIGDEEYYRFIVHPRILFEIPARINAEYWSAARDTSLISFEQWLRHEPEDLLGSSEAHVFWREYIPSDTLKGRTIAERMGLSTTYEEAVLRICNFQSHSQPEGMMTFGYATNDLQPMVIYMKAYGSCGEQSILQTALCRAFFIPAYVVGCRGEDHQWAHYLDPLTGRWNHWDINYGLQGLGNPWVSGEGVEHRDKTISTVTAFGPDNEVWPVTRSVAGSPGSGYVSGDSGYTETAFVEISVADPAGTPVEGAMVLARSHWRNANAVSAFTYTGPDGECSLELGWQPFGGYTIDIVSPFGSAGSSNISFTEGMSYRINYEVPLTVPERQETVLLPDPAPHRAGATAEMFPVSYYSGSLYSLEGDSGTAGHRDWTSRPPMKVETSCVFMDGSNFRRYREGEHFRAVSRPFIPLPDDTCFAVLDNRNSMFTWRTYEQIELPPMMSDDETAGAISWLNEPLSTREICITGLSSQSVHVDADPSEAGWAASYSSLSVCQDDPDDPLSAGRVVGPFRIPPSERSFSIEVSGEAPGLDVDLFLFRDRNSNRMVDGMDEMIASSTTPTSNERITLHDIDTGSAHWIYLHGWQVPQDTGSVDLRLSFRPDTLIIHSLRPAGYTSSLPEKFSFLLSPAAPPEGGILLGLAGELVRPVLSEEGWSFGSTEFAAMEIPETVTVHAADMTVLETLDWVVNVDSMKPELHLFDMVVDPKDMTAVATVLCYDSISGIARVSLAVEDADSLALSSNGDSSYTAMLDLLPFAGREVRMDLAVADSAGNETDSLLMVPVPERPPVVFRELHPTGVIYDHSPVIQVMADFAEEPREWNSTAVLRDSTGSYSVELAPILVDGTIVQFIHEELLRNGPHEVTVRVTGERGDPIGERAWSFTVSAMTSGS